MHDIDIDQRVALLCIHDMAERLKWDTAYSSMEQEPLFLQDATGLRTCCSLLLALPGVPLRCPRHMGCDVGGFCWAPSCAQQ